MKDKKKIIVGALVMALVVVSVGYAAITTINLNITGTATATPDTTNFKVEFTGTPDVSDSSKVTAEIDATDKKKATINVSGLKAKNDFETVTYTVKNLSADLSASLAATVTKNTNEEYFKVEPTITAATIGASNTAELTVKVTLIKTPIEADVDSDIVVTLAADPVQPTNP